MTIDGTVVGSIAKNETTELRVEPGPHTLRLQSKRHVSRERPFDVSDGRVISFSSHEPRLWPFFVAALIKPDLWITLKQD